MPRAHQVCSYLILEPASATECLPMGEDLQEGRGKLRPHRPPRWVLLNWAGQGGQVDSLSKGFPLKLST